MWLEKAIDRGFRIKRAHYFPEFIGLDSPAVNAALEKMDGLADRERIRYAERGRSTD